MIKRKNLTLMIICIIGKILVIAAVLAFTLVAVHITGDNKYFFMLFLLPIASLIPTYEIKFTHKTLGEITIEDDPDLDVVDEDETLE